MGSKAKLIAAAAAAVLAAWALGFCLAHGGFGAWPAPGVQDVKAYIKDAGPWGVLISIGLMVAHSFIPFPSEIITMANGMVYGVLWGSVISWAGAMLGALVAFGLSRLLGRRYVERFIQSRHMERAERMIERYGTGALLFVRLLPIFSFNLINYLAGLTSISLWTFIWTTAVGMLPMTVLMSLMGHSAQGLPWEAWAGLLIAGLLIWFLVQRARSYYKHYG